MKLNEQTAKQYILALNGQKGKLLTALETYLHRPTAMSAAICEELIHQSGGLKTLQEQKEKDK